MWMQDDGLKSMQRFTVVGETHSTVQSQLTLFHSFSSACQVTLYLYIRGYIIPVSVVMGHVCSICASELKAIFLLLVFPTHVLSKMLKRATRGHHGAGKAGTSIHSLYQALSSVLGVWSMA